jgi:hypothetical protein
MPEYGFNLNLSPQTKPTSIADMLNIANSAQQFQQAQQLNPLQVQQAQQLLRQNQLATQKAEALVPEEIQTGVLTSQEERKRQPLATSEKQFDYDKKNADRAFQLMTGFLRDPAIINAAKDPAGAKQVLNDMNTLLINGGVDKRITKLHMDELTNVAENHPEKLVSVLQNIGTAAISSSEQAASRRPQLTTTAGGAPALYTAEPGTITQPNIQGQQGQQQQTQLGEPTTQTQQQLPKVGGVTLSYPVRKAGDLSPLAPSEESDRKYQQTQRQSLLDRQRTLTDAERVSDEVIKAAEQLKKEAFFTKGGIAANLERKLQMFAQSEKYDQLAKDLANQTIQNAKVLGISDSVGGLNMSDAANGTIKIPPDVLIEIARRNKANQVNIDLQAKAKNSFSQQFGDNNGSTFDQIWRSNSDSKLFEAMSIEKSKMPYKEKQAAYKKLFEGLAPQDLADFKNKKANIDAMVNGNFTGVK